MDLLLFSLAMITLSSFISCAIRKKPLLSAGISAAGNLIGAICGLFPSVDTLLTGQPQALQLDWAMPYGSFFIEIDPLSSVFLIPIFVLSALTAIYGVRYLTAHPGKPIGVASCFFNILVACMIMVVIARNAILFLIAWEIMSLSSFFLVTFDDEHPHVRRAGFIYLIATHIGTVFLIALFVCLGQETGSLNFSTFQNLASLAPATASLLFLFALIGFGTKAGLMPLHVWLPEAHPAAPSHVSALMSGVMIKTGIYGIIRTLTFLPETQAWWGWLLVLIGAISGLLGVLFALAQHDIKRLLAYHSVENIGIITIGIGIGVIGIHSGSAFLAVAGFAGALLHVVNHAFFKGLLFLGAGAIIQAAGTRDIDRFGGLIKRMPWTAGAFLIGSIAICGLPPLNGFVSEFLVYYGAFHGAIIGKIEVFLPAILAIGSLAGIGGLALACFTKSFGITFLGEARTEAAKKAHEVGISMQLAMWFLAAACGLIAFCSPLIIPALEHVLHDITGMERTIVAIPLTAMASVLNMIILISGLLACFLIALICLRSFFFSKRRKIEHGVTWDCGYADPTVAHAIYRGIFCRTTRNAYTVNPPHPRNCTQT